jgi:dGTPase
MKEVVRGLINWLVAGLLEGTIAAGQRLTNLDAVRDHPSRIARFSEATAAGTRELKNFLREKVYSSPALVQARSQSAGRIPALFEFFLEHPDRLSAAHRDESGDPLHRRVCDYIAGMTDGYFAKTCQQMGIA